MSFKSYESKISPFLRASLILKEYSVGLKKKKGSKNCLQSFTSFKGFQGGSCFMFTLQQELIHRAMGLVLQAGQFWQSINKDCLATNVVSSFFSAAEMMLFLHFQLFCLFL